MLQYKEGYAHILEGNFKIIISEGLVISSKLSHTIFTLDSTTCNMKGHIKLVDRLSNPLDRLIH